MYGWTGNIVKINLSTGEQTRVVIEESLYEQYLGGRGLGVKLYTDLYDNTIQPFHEENALLFMTGPLTGVYPTSGRYQVISRSPLTGTICDASSGGIWGARLKKAGLDGLIITGRAVKPVFLEVTDRSIQIRSAEKLWGKDTHQTKALLTELVENGSSMAVIGPAGENRVLFAGIMNDNDRYAGRGGLGAVMGSKNLKAITVKGSQEICVKDPEALKRFGKKLDRLIDKNPITGKSLQLLGTSVLMNIMNSHGLLGTRNFQEGIFNDAEGISGEKMSENLVTKKSACFKCPIACGRVSRLRGEEVDGPEFETAWAFGAQIGNNDLNFIAEANSLCNKLGIDTISCGNTIGCAMELSEKGFIKQKISWGDTNMARELITAIARRKKGLGDDLALGSKRLAEKYGAPQLAMHVKGMELPAYDPRGVQGQALAYVTNNRGGCHIKAYLIGPEILGAPVFLDRFTTKGKPEIVILLQNIAAAVDSLIMCRFLEFAVSIDTFSEMLNIVTGKSYTGSDLIGIGEKIFDLERNYNCRAGYDKDDDRLPARFSRETLKEGPSRERLVDLDEMLKKYYQLRGWDKQGRPDPQVLDDREIKN